MSYEEPIAAYFMTVAKMTLQAQKLQNNVKKSC